MYHLLHCFVILASLLRPGGRLTRLLLLFLHLLEAHSFGLVCLVVGALLLLAICLLLRCNLREPQYGFGTDFGERAFVQVDILLKSHVV